MERKLRMDLIQRLGSNSQYDNDYINFLIENHKKNKGSFDEVWLATDYGFPAIEKHIEHAKELGEIAERFRKNGITVSLQLSNSIGHGQYMSSRDCSGLVCENGADPIIGPDGTVSKYCFCWHGEKFQNYLSRELEAYLKSIRPACLWVDDDFRADNHFPVEHACFCDSCLTRFNTRESTSYTRESLNKALINDIDVRVKWMHFTQEGIADLMRKICLIVKEVSPETDIGLQNASHGYTGYGLGFIYDTILETIGRTPRVRPGGGAYNDHNPNYMLNKMFDISYQAASTPDYVSYIAPEIENLPFCYSGKSSAGTAFETSVYLASGSTGMTYSMMMSTPESPEFYEGYFKLFSSQRAYWDKLANVSMISRGAGISLAIAKKFFERPLSEGANISDYAVENYHGPDNFERLGVPITFDHVDGMPFLLHPETAAAMNDDEIRHMLSMSVITDGETIDLLRARGFFTDTSSKGIGYGDALRIRERYSDHPLTAGLSEGRFMPSTMTPGKNDVYAFDKIPSTAQIIGTYENTAKLDPFFDGEYPYGISSFVFDTPEGGRIAVFGCGLWKCVIPSSRRALILKTANEISDIKLAAEPVSADQIMLLPRVSTDGRETLSVSVTNLTVGVLENVKILVRRAKGTPVFDAQYVLKTTIDITDTDDGMILTLPPIAPYSVATVFFEK